MQISVINQSAYKIASVPITILRLTWWCVKGVKTLSSSFSWPCEVTALRELVRGDEKSTREMLIRCPGSAEMSHLRWWRWLQGSWSTAIEPEMVCRCWETEEQSFWARLRTVGVVIYGCYSKIWVIGLA